MGHIRRIVLDVLKPHSPSIVEVAERLSAIRGISGVNIMLDEVDQETETIKITIGGANIKVDSVYKALEEMGASVHSVDAVMAGDKIIEDIETPQD